MQYKECWKSIVVNFETGKKLWFNLKERDLSFKALSGDLKKFPGKVEDRVFRHVFQKMLPLFLEATELEVRPNFSDDIPSDLFSPISDADMEIVKKAYKIGERSRSSFKISECENWQEKADLGDAEDLADAQQKVLAKTHAWVYHDKMFRLVPYEPLPDGESDFRYEYDSNAGGTTPRHRFSIRQYRRVATPTKVFWERVDGVVTPPVLKPQAVPKVKNYEFTNLNIPEDTLQKILVGETPPGETEKILHDATTAALNKD